MPKISTLTLKTHANVDVPFTFESAVGRVITLRDSTATVFGKAARVHLEVKTPQAGANGLIRFKETLKVPLYDSLGAVRGYSTRIVEDLIPVDSTDVERKEFTARAAALGSNTVLRDGQNNLDFWS